MDSKKESQENGCPIVSELSTIFKQIRGGKDGSESCS